MSAAAFQHVQGLNAVEAERLVQKLQAFKPNEIGNSQWMDQHHVLEKLNVQAQMCIVNNSDEFVLEALNDFEKIPVLVNELLVLDAWKQKVLPEIFDELAEKNNVKTYFVLYNEALLIGLLEKAFFHVHIMKGAGECLIDLADYCYRRLMFLCQPDLSQKIADSVNEGRQIDIKATSSIDHSKALFNQRLEVDFGVAMSAISLVRSMSESADELPLGVMSRLMDENDVLMSLVPLLESAPWKRRNKDGKFEKFSDGRWHVVEGDDVLRLSKPEAQVWLCLYHLMLSPACQQRYDWDDFKKNNALRARKFMTEVLMDQLPVLSDLARFLDQLSLSAPPQASKGALLISQVPELWESIMSGTDWKSARRDTRNNIANASKEDRMEEMKKLADVYGANNFEEFMGDPKCSKCGQPAEQRCSRCKLEWYCSRECQVASWKEHKTLCNTLHEASKIQAV